MDPGSSDLGGTISVVTLFTSVAQNHIILSVFLFTVVARAIIGGGSSCGKHHGYWVPCLP